MIIKKKTRAHGYVHRSNRSRSDDNGGVGGWKGRVTGMIRYEISISLLRENEDNGKRLKGKRRS